MREDPGLDVAKIVVCLQAHYGLRVASVAFLPVGYDPNAAVYEVDIVATLKRPEGNHAENVRQLETIGRSGATKLNIELTEEGYVPLGSDDKVAFSKVVKLIRGVLPRRKENAITEDALVEKVKGEVSKGTLIRALRWLVDQETVVREGSGK